MLLTTLVLAIATAGQGPSLAAQQDKAKQGKAEQGTPAGVTLYDRDPNHLWNRLHQALYFRLTDLGQPDKEQTLLPGDQSHHAYELDACLWPNGSTYLRFGEPHKAALRVLDEFLAKDGESLVKEPTKRAFLQRDLWAVFDWTRSWHSDAAYRNLRTRLAKAIQRLALSPEEIKRLPDNFAAVAAAKEFRDFPADLWDPRGRWVLIGDDIKGIGARSITPVHDSFFGSRSAFLVLIGEGDSRDKTIQFLKQLNENNKPALDVRVALVRRMLLVDNQGRIRLSPITESVQLRGAGEREFKLNRKDFLEGKIQKSIHRIGDDDNERPDILYLGRNAGDRPEPILKSCGRCHGGRDLNSRSQLFSDQVGPARARPRLNDSTLEHESARSIFWKSNQFTWGKLQGLWEAEIGKAEQAKAEQGTPVAVSAATQVKRNIPYAEPAHERQVLDVYSPKNAKDLPVVFWIHGGGWQTGDKTSVQLKPKVFVDKGFVFVSTNYRLLPNVDIATIFRDIAKSIRWVHDHAAEHGGDPKRLFIMGHSAGAQLAALVCTDDRYLKAEGLSLAIIKGCVPVDGDTFDVPAIIETAETRRRVHGLPQAKFGHREKFGNDPAKHRDFSAVTHVAKDKGIPPFLILHVADHPDTTAQAQRFGNVLKDAGVPVTVFGARETTHAKINADLGKPDDPATKALLEFVDKALKK